MHVFVKKTVPPVIKDTFTPDLQAYNQFWTLGNFWKITR